MTPTDKLHISRQQAADHSPGWGPQPHHGRADSLRLRPDKWGDQVSCNDLNKKSHIYHCSVFSQHTTHLSVPNLTTNNANASFQGMS